MKRIALAIWLALSGLVPLSANATQPGLTVAVAVVSEQQKNSTKIAGYVAALEDVAMMRKILTSVDFQGPEQPDVQNVEEIRNVIAIFADELLALRAGRGDLSQAERKRQIAEHEATLLGLIRAKDDAIATTQNQFAVGEARHAAHADMEMAVARAVQALEAALGYSATPEFAERLHRILGIAAPDPALIAALGVDAPAQMAALETP